MSIVCSTLLQFNIAHVHCTLRVQIWTLIVQCTLELFTKKHTLELLNLFLIQQPKKASTLSIPQMIKQECIVSAGPMVCSTIFSKKISTLPPPHTHTPSPATPNCPQRLSLHPKFKGVKKKEEEENRGESPPEDPQFHLQGRWVNTHKCNNCAGILARHVDLFVILGLILGQLGG